MKAGNKTVTLLPYGRLSNWPGLFASTGSNPRVRIVRNWKRSQRPAAHGPAHVLIAFSQELDEAFVHAFRERAPRDTRLLVLNDSQSSDRLLSRMVDLQIRSTHRFYVADPPFSPSSDKKWEDFIRSFVGRLTAAGESEENHGRILDARVEGVTLHVVSTDFRRLEIPIATIPALAKSNEGSAERFEIDEDGSFLYWHVLDLHLGWEQLQQAIDPAAAHRAQQKSHEFNVRYGAAIRVVRERKGLSLSAIPGLSDKQLRRIERGECRLTSRAATSLAQAHRRTPNEYLAAVAEALK